MNFGTYNPGLVALSFGVAAIASWTALELAGRVSTLSGRIEAIWLAAGSFSMGFGIWTVHFVSMLALGLRLPHSYDPSLTALSLLLAVAASTCAIWIASRKSVNPARIGVSGLLMGGGFAGVHYTGMAAVQMQAEVVYEPAGLVTSVVIAIAAATAAIWIIFSLLHRVSSKTRLPWYKAGAALILASAICGTHYTGVAAATIVPFENALILNASLGDSAFAGVLAIAALIILGMTLLTISFDNRVAAEQSRGSAAQEQANQLSALLDESLNEFYVIDIPTLRIVNVNKGACEHLGYQADELKLMTPMDVCVGLTEDAFCDAVEQLADGTHRTNVLECVHRRADGSTYPVEVNLQLFLMHGRPVALEIASDITRRKSLEEQLAQARKLESIGQLAAGIAHEINTPAQYVGDNTRFIKDMMGDVLELINASQRLYTANREFSVTPELLLELRDLLQAVDPEYLAEEIPAAIDQSLDGISRISSIVRAMKEFSHPGSKSHEHVDINRVVQNTITVAANEWKYVAEVETDLAADLPSVPCMSQQIGQVILNLVVNAAQAIRDNREEGSTAKGTISIGTRRSADHVEIQISDTGGGIPDSIKDRVFDPFFTTKEVGKGTGQGLSIAYKTIVKGHNGDLSFDSKAGVGTTFVISLPLTVDLKDAMEEVA